MAAPCFIAWAGDTSASTGPPAGITVTAQKTVLQLKASSTQGLRIIEWGYAVSAPPSAPIQWELVDTAAVAATVTTIGSGIRAYNNASQTASNAVIGTAASGFNASAEGSITASRLLAYQYDTALWFKQQFPLGREPDILPNDILRIRCTPQASTVVQVFLVWEE
jgi:hypothetical protein